MAIRTDLVVCPETKAPLDLVDLDEARRRIAGGADLHPATGAFDPVGPTPTVLVTVDAARAYPVQDGFPVLLAPEALTAAAAVRLVDVDDPMYAEAYEEMAHYNEAGRADARAVGTSTA